jgi:lipopolysaccharide/colanic/teichoic acid biosynthesis glycosyltransferase
VIKRTLDFAVAAVGLVLLSPVMAVVALAVWYKLGRPILFVQERPGLGARPIRVFKFRTMHDARDGRGDPLPDSERLPAFGRRLRRWSLDELPQLVNVIRGDLSLVGPRPLLPEYLPLYSARQARRHDVRPGITGWAQVHGRNAVTWPQRLELDVWYVEHRSLWLDLRILIMTVGALLSARERASDGSVLMERFAGERAADGWLPTSPQR